MNTTIVLLDSVKPQVTFDIINEVSVFYSMANERLASANCFREG
jgi:hypothetical protein